MPHILSTSGWFYTRVRLLPCGCFYGLVHIKIQNFRAGHLGVSQNRVPQNGAQYTMILIDPKEKGLLIFRHSHILTVFLLGPVYFGGHWRQDVIFYNDVAQASALTVNTSGKAKGHGFDIRTLVGTKCIAARTQMAVSKTRVPNVGLT